jgi:hypothetical protein
MKLTTLAFSLLTSAFLSGCTNPPAATNTVTYTVPPFTYEQTESTFNPQPPALPAPPSAPASVPAVTTIRLTWNYPTNELAGIDKFKIYFSTNAAAPLTNWVVLTNVTSPALTATVALAPQAGFFFCTASNFWGESLPSNTNALPAPPRFINSLAIQPP